MLSSKSKPKTLKQQSQNVKKTYRSCPLHVHCCLGGLKYSISLSDDAKLEDVDEDELLITPLLKLFEWFLSSTGAAGCLPSSANLRRMFITVGRNFVDKERSPGS